MGQELTFGDRLAEAETSVEEAVGIPAINQNDPGLGEETEPNPLAQEAEANPSFVVIRAWEQTLSALEYLAGIGLKDVDWRLRRGPLVARELRKANLINANVAAAIDDLRGLRNSVAHGQHNPTPCEAIAYAESAQSISTFLRMKAEIISAETGAAE